MIANSIVAATVVMTALFFLVLQETRFLIPYKPLLHRYSAFIYTYAAVLFLNIFAVTFLFARKLFLKDTGRKLAHIEKQIRTDDSVSEELSHRIKE